MMPQNGVRAAELLGLTVASDIGGVFRFPAARKLVGYTTRRRTKPQVSDVAAGTSCRGRIRASSEVIPSRVHAEGQSARPSVPSPLL